MDSATAPLDLGLDTSIICQRTQKSHLTMTLKGGLQNLDGVWILKWPCNQLQPWNSPASSGTFRKSHPSMPQEAGLQTSVPLQILKHRCNPAPALPTCPPRDIPNDLMGAFSRTRWEPHPSKNLITAPFPDSTINLEISHYPSTSSTDQGPRDSAICPETRQDPCPPGPLVKGPLTTDATRGSEAAT